MRAPVDVLICEAIRERRLLAIEYGGSRRLVQPHVYGDDPAGDRLLSAYQVSGGSTSGAPHGWKSFRMDRVGSVASTTERFHRAQPDYRCDDGAFARVLCQL